MLRTTPKWCNYACLVHHLGKLKLKHPNPPTIELLFESGSPTNIDKNTSLSHPNTTSQSSPTPGPAMAMEPVDPVVPQAADFNDFDGRNSGTWMDNWVDALDMIWILDMGILSDIWIGYSWSHLLDPNRGFSIGILVGSLAVHWLVWQYHCVLDVHPGHILLPIPKNTGH